MKVLEKGNGWGIEVKCTGNGNGNGDCGCGAKLFVEKDDIYLTHSYDYAGDHDIFYTVRCIDCGEETDIDEQDIPIGIRRRLLDGYRDTINRGRTR